MHVLLPIKNLNFAKQRLASLLSPAERRAFFQTMLKDVLSVLNDHKLVSDITLLSDDPSTQQLTGQYRLNCLNQSSLGTRGLSNTVQAGVRHLARQGISDVMVLHGDLPLISDSEVSQLILRHTAELKPGITLTPDRHGKGTNCIISSTKSDFEFHYGDDSFDKHRARALLCGIQPLIIQQAGISCDIDYPCDLLQFLTQVDTDSARYTHAFLRKHKIIDRLLEHNHTTQPAQTHSRSATVVNIETERKRVRYAR